MYGMGEENEMISIFSEPKFHKIRGNWTIEPAADHSWRRIPVILALGIALAVPGRYWPPAERPSITFAVRPEPNGVGWEECKSIAGGNSTCVAVNPLIGEGPCKYLGDGSFECGVQK